MKGQTFRHKCPATGKSCKASHPLQCFGGAACPIEEAEARRRKDAVRFSSDGICIKLLRDADYIEANGYSMRAANMRAAAAHIKALLNELRQDGEP